MGGLIKLTKVLFLASLLAWAMTFFIIRRVPKNVIFREELREMPTINLYEGQETTIKKGEYTARLETVGDYEIAGFVVAEYDSENWLDYTHRFDPFNTKDLCIIWGENAKDGRYEDYDFWHGEFTCYTRAKKWPVKNEVLAQHVSNNHLLPASDQIYQAIKSAHIGDQVRFRGQLVNYRIETADFQTGYRYTSTKPFDNNCEVIYTTDFETLESAHHTNRQINFFTMITTPLLLLFLIVLGLIDLRPKKIE